MPKSAADVFLHLVEVAKIAREHDIALNASFGVNNADLHIDITPPEIRRLRPDLPVLTLREILEAADEDLKPKSKDPDGSFLG